jgi:hypothetical protein
MDGLVARYSATLNDQYGRPVGGALVTVTSSTSNTLAALTNDDSSILTNPFTTNATGAVVFNTADGLYDIVYRYGGRVLREDFAVSVGNVVLGSAIVDALGNGTDVAPSQNIVTVNINALSASVATKVDAAGALAAAVGPAANQAPTRTEVGTTLLSYVPFSTLNAAGGAGQVGFKATPVGTVLRNIDAKIKETRVITPEDFGAVGDVLGNFPATNNVNPSPTDNATALAAMAAAVGPNVRVKFNAVYATSQPITFPQVNYVTLEGVNEYTCGILYIGASTTTDIIKIGDGTSEINGWNIRRLIIDSKTRMTAGAALHVKRAIFFDYENLVIHGQYGNLQTSPSQATSAQNLFNGFLQEGYLYCHMIQPDVFVRNTAIGLCGWDLGGGNFFSYGANFIIYGGKKIAGSGTGVLMGGGCYAVSLDDVDIIGNIQNNLRMSQELYPHANGLLFCKQCTFDSIQVIAGAGANVLINDAGDSFTQPGLLWDGTWCATGPAHGLVIQNMGSTQYAFAHLVGCRLGNFGSSGTAIKIMTPTPVIDILNTKIFTSGIGIDASGAGGSGGNPFRNVRAKNVSMQGVLTAYTGHIEGFLDTWTPTFGSDFGGTLATQPTIQYAEYIDSGQLSYGNSSGATVERLVHFRISFTMPASVPGSVGQLTITLPWTAAVREHLSIQGIGNTSLGTLYGIATGGNNLRILANAGGTTVKANEQMVVTGWYIANQNFQSS